MSILEADAADASPQQERWNKVFARPDSGFNKQPNSFLMKSVQGMAPGRALEIGMGQGRNILADASKFDYGNDRYELIYATFEQQIVTDMRPRLSRR